MTVTVPREQPSRPTLLEPLRSDMVVAQNKGSPKWTPIYYNPYYGDPQKCTPNLGKPPYRLPKRGEKLRRRKTLRLGLTRGGTQFDNKAV